MWKTKYRIVKKTRRSDIRGKDCWERITYQVQSRPGWWPLWATDVHYEYCRRRDSYGILNEAKHRIKELKSSCGKKIRSESEVIHTE